MIIELEFTVSVEIEKQEGKIVDPRSFIKKGKGITEIELDSYCGLTQIAFFNTKQGHFDNIYIVGDDLSFDAIRPQLVQYANDNHSRMTGIEVEIDGKYYQLVGKSTEDLKEEIQEALAQENWGKVAELATINMI